MTKNITPDIRYIGVDDPEQHLFESQYHTPDGMCYNSYVILDEKVAVMDTSDSRTMEAWKANLAEALNGRQPDYLIVHHLEPDHASGIAEVCALYPQMQIVCSAKALQMMPQYMTTPHSAPEGATAPLKAASTTTEAPSGAVGGGTPILTVKEGDTLALGRHTLHFVMAPMVHWPEVMVSYDDADRVLFSADGFGKFGVYDADADDWACEARRYYFNICGKYGTPVSTLLKKAAALDIQKILPLHGPVLEGEKLAEAVRLYTIWSAYDVETEGVFIAHASIHGNTAAAAARLAEILKAKGCPKVAVSDLCRDDLAEAIEDAFRYGRMICMASSYDAGVFPPMYDFLHHLEIKAYQRRRVALVENGSWAPSAAKTMRPMLEGMKQVEVVEPVVTLRGTLKDTDIPALEALAEALINA
ncbi:MAG: FprA family A-type flavoprotein [Bacteroidaceae bacterium]|nr:FprA family A-type flavoprotein [Bacteroidaceae bacterium]